MTLKTDHAPVRSTTPPGPSVPPPPSPVSPLPPSPGDRARPFPDSDERLAYEAATTRKRIDETLEALAFELKPGSILRRKITGDSHASNDDIKHELKDTMLKTLKRNPIGLGLLTTGLAWMIFTRDDRRLFRSAAAKFTSEPRDYTDRPRAAGTGTATTAPPRAGYYPYASRTRTDSGHTRDSDTTSRTGFYLRDRLGSAVSGIGSAISASAGSVKSAAGTTGRGIADAGRFAADRTGSAASSAADATGRLAGGIAETTSDAAGWVGDKASDAGAATAEYAGEAARWTRQQSREKPIAMTLAAVAAGLLVGSLLPATRIEDEYLGEYGDAARDRMRDKAMAAKERGLDTLREQGLDADLGEKAKEVASAALAGAKDAAETEAREQNVHPEQVRDTAKEAAAEAHAGAKQA